MRTPPGRAGRLWLVHRLEIAGRGRDVLEQKRRALMHQRERLGPELAEARRDWEQNARDANRWWQLAAVFGGERSLELATAGPLRPASVVIDWRNSLGVVYPADVDVEPGGPLAAPVGGSAALVEAYAAYRRALTTAARFAAARIAWERTEAELEGTILRLRAIDRRWIPHHERALAELELALDESERTEVAHVRWFRDRLGERD